jgi:hypothetical protein
MLHSLRGTAILIPLGARVDIIYSPSSFVETFPDIIIESFSTDLKPMNEDMDIPLGFVSI